ncbi:MAG: hypothetical protein IKN43_07795 [Selenomonadaceae bacterium]|nr:hypothetical protein [Selenomonadaceae bacterium]
MLMETVMSKNIKLTKNSKIYILCPRGIRTGGPTLMHQLASEIVKIYGDSITPFMRYYNISYKNAPADAYSEYHIKTAYDIVDSPENLVIVPETATDFLKFCPKCQKVIWWLSVDNYVSHLQTVYSDFLKAGKFLFPLPAPFNFSGGDDIFHFAQSRYALNFLRVNKISEDKIFYVGDYLQLIFLQRAKHIDISQKEPIVVYNPKKGGDFTEKLITAAPDIKFVPIQDMTSEEVEVLLALAMVYIDFGNHPGKDRIPREAAISGCTVITGKRGSAANDEDIPIESEFKFEDNDENIPNIINKIKEIFADFPKFHHKFDPYRKIILDEPKKFKRDLVKALNFKVKEMPTTIALLQSGARGRVLY